MELEEGQSGGQEPQGGGGSPHGQKAPGPRRRLTHRWDLFLRDKEVTSENEGWGRTPLRNRQGFPEGQRDRCCHL